MALTNEPTPDAPLAPEVAPEAAPVAPVEGQAVPWEEYVKLRTENADYRKKWQPYETTFSDESTQAFKAAADSLAAGDTDAVAAWMVRNAAAALGVSTEDLMALAGDDEEAQEEITTEGELTPETVQRLVDERVTEAMTAQQQTQLESQTQAVVQEVEDAGFPQNTPEHMLVLWHATNTFDGDLDKAVAKVNGMSQEAVDNYLAKRREDAKGAPRQTEGQTPGTGRKIKLEDAREAAEEWLEQRT